MFLSNLWPICMEVREYINYFGRLASLNVISLSPVKMCQQPAILPPSVNFLPLTPHWTSLGALSSRQGDLVFAG